MIGLIRDSEPYERVFFGVMGILVLALLLLFGWAIYDMRSNYLARQPILFTLESRNEDSYITFVNVCVTRVCTMIPQNHTNYTLCGRDETHEQEVCAETDWEIYELVSTKGETYEVTATYTDGGDVIIYEAKNDLYD